MVQLPPPPEAFAGRAVSTHEVYRGARSFMLTEAGRLTGIVFKQEWLPGVNYAECRRVESAPVMYFAPVGVVAPTVPVQVPAYVQPHEMDTCPHGFYAYFDGSNDYARPAAVSGVIEGYGTVLLGSRGFRCTKARIVALQVSMGSLHGSDQGSLLAALMDRFVGVPFFWSFEAMVAEFPPGVEAVTPDWWDGL